MSRKRAIWGMLVPRPSSFFFNLLIVVGGAFFAALEGYSGWISGDPWAMPAWLFLLLWLLVQELFVQQAKYMWNDIRDHEGKRE